MSKVVPITDEQVKRAGEDLERMKAFRGLMADYHREEARILHDKFQALIEAGFNEDQALQLLKNP